MAISGSIDPEANPCSQRFLELLNEVALLKASSFLAMSPGPNILLKISVRFRLRFCLILLGLHYY